MRQVALQDPLLHQAAALVLVRLQRPDHGLRVGVDALLLEQHPTAERQLPHHAGTGQQRQRRAQFLVGEPLELAGQLQLQRLGQFVETELNAISEGLSSRCTGAIVRCDLEALSQPFSQNGDSTFVNNMVESAQIDRKFLGSLGQEHNVLA